MDIERRSFADKTALAKELAETVAARIEAAIARDGVAAIAVSGGSTPAKFFSVLGKTKTLDWEKVIVTLVDERWVDELNDRSNAKLVNEKLLQGPAAVARFVPLYSGGDEPDASGVERTNALLAELPDRFAAVVLGMGNDGHTASFFPGGDTLDQVLSDEGPAMALRAPGAGEPRITLTLPRLLRAEGIYLHVEGEEKAATLEQALGEGPVGDMPVRAVLRSGQPVTVFWCP